MIYTEENPSPFISKDKKVRSIAHRSLIGGLTARGFRGNRQREYPKLPEMHKPETWDQPGEYSDTLIAQISEFSKRTKYLKSPGESSTHWVHGNGQTIPMGQLMWATFYWPLEEIFTDLVDPLCEDDE